MGERSQEERRRVGRRKQKMPGHSEECGQSNVCKYSPACSTEGEANTPDAEGEKLQGHGAAGLSLHASVGG